MDLVRRVQDILLRPKQTWPVIKSEGTTIAGVYTSYVLILAAMPAAAEVIGFAFTRVSVMGLRHSMPFESTLAHGLVSYGISLASIYVVAVIAAGLAPRFTSQKNLVNAFKLAAYSWTPSWVVGVLLVMPALSWLVALVSLYGLYLFYCGLPLLMDTPRDKVTPYFLAVIVASMVAVGFIRATVRLLLLPGMLV